MTEVGGLEKTIGCVGRSFEVSSVRLDSATCST
jgi:hypothetical protein